MLRASGWMSPSPRGDSPLAGLFRRLGGTIAIVLSAAGHADAQLVDLSPGSLHSHAIACIVQAGELLDFASQPLPLLYSGDQEVGRLAPPEEPCSPDLARYQALFVRIEVLRAKSAARVLGERARGGLVRVYLPG